MLSDIELAQIEKMAANFYILGYLIIISSASKTQQMEVEKQNFAYIFPSTSDMPTPAELVFTASSIFTISNIILTALAFARLRKVQEGIQLGTEKGTLTPNIYITLGWVVSVIGSLLRLKGSQLRVAEQQTITIL